MRGEVGQMGHMGQLGQAGQVTPAKPILSEFCFLRLSMFYEAAPSKDIQGCRRSRRL